MPVKLDLIVLTLAFQYKRNLDSFIAVYKDDFYRYESLISNLLLY